MQQFQDTYYDTQSVAERLKLSTRTLERWRLEGCGPRFARLGRRIVYAESALSEWIAGNTFASTSAADAQERA